jgi:hypothetical protein
VQEEMKSTAFDFWGVTASVSSESAEIVEDLRRDFSFFEKESADADIRLRCELKDPSDVKLPPYEAIRYGKDSITYGRGGLQATDYRGEGLTVYDFKRESGEVYAKDRARLHELAYLLIMSRVGERLDMRGLHRVHGFALERNGDGFIFLMPEGGGKTTLALRLMRLGGLRLLSDDTPIVDGRDIFAFPLRIGLSPADAEGIPPKWRRDFKRTGRRDKVLVDVGYFGEAVAKRAAAKMIIVGVRTLSDKPMIERVSRLRLLRPLTRDLVFGLGIPQVVEHFLRGTADDIPRKMWIFARRLWCALLLAARCEAYVMRTGTDRDENARALAGILADGAKDR